MGSKFDGFGLNLYFAEDILIAKEYCLGKEPNADKFEYLKSALIKKYGDCSEDNDVFRKYEAVKGHKEPNDESIASIVSDDSAFATWRLDDGTEIFLFVFNLSYSYHINYEIIRGTGISTLLTAMTEYAIYDPDETDKLKEVIVKDEGIYCGTFVFRRGKGIQ